MIFPLILQTIIKPHLHDATSCQTGLTTSCIMYTNIQPVVKPVWQPAVSCKRTVGCLFTRYNRLSNRRIPLMWQRDGH